MRIFNLVVAQTMFAVLLMITFTVSAALPPEVNGQPLPSLAPMLEHVTPAVVNIAAQGSVTVAGPVDKNNSDTDGSNTVSRDFASLGSGVIIDAQNGLLITNAHVIKDAKTITVTLNDGRTFKAQLKGVDVDSDVALLHIDADHLTSLPIADSDKLKVGDFVAAIGNPYGLSETVTSGIISGLQRGNLGIEGAQGIEDFIQTDASINPGNSGGPLVNLNGQLIGINTAILAPSGGNVGIGFAIPSNLIHIVVQQLLQYGSVKRGLMGVIVQDFTPDLAKAFNIPSIKGAVVTQTTPNSPAEKIGILPGDVIVKVNGIAMNDAPAVRNAVGLLRVGAKIDVEIVRNGKIIDYDLVTADPDVYMQQTQQNNPFLYGLSLRNFEEQTATQGYVTGVQILYVSKDSPAWRAGLRRGDVIVSANKVSVATVAQLENAAQKNKDHLLLNVIVSSGGALFVVIS